MRGALVLSALISLAGCESAAKHPAITIGSVAGTMGFGLCEISVAELGTCGIVGGTAALALGGITALVTLLADTTAHEDPSLQEQGPREYVTEPPPGLPAWMQNDAGVPLQPVTQSDAGVPPQPQPVTQSDAGVSRIDAATVDAM